MKIKWESIGATALFLSFNVFTNAVSAMEESELDAAELRNSIIVKSIQEEDMDAAGDRGASAREKFSDAELRYLPAYKLLELFRSKQLSPVDVLEAQIKSIELLNPSINAISSKHYDEARLQAMESELRYELGIYRPLDGLTVLVKNEIEVKGWVVTMGSLTLEKAPPCTEDAAIITFLRNAGVVMHAQTNVPEFCCHVITWSNLSGVSRNPWNTNYTPGGSSGGSSSALAAGFGTLALGSDMGGSIRIPAAMTALYGFKPPYGRVPTSLVQYESYGPMARTIEDLYLLQKTIAGKSPKIISSLPLKKNYLKPREDIKGWRIAYDPMTQWGIPIDGTVKKSMEESVERLQSLGVVVEQVDLGFRAEDFEIYGLGLLSTSMGFFCFHNPLEYPQLTSAYMNNLVEKYAQKTSNIHIAIAENWMKSKHQQVQEKVFLQGFKAIIMPTMCTPYVPADMGITSTNNFITINGEQHKADTWNFVLTWPWNMLGQYPVMNVPNGITHDGVPMGMQIIPNTYEDDIAFQIASQWSKVMPDLYRLKTTL